jgi:hypothetical protein
LADYGGAWGWQTDKYDDGTTDYYNMASCLATEIGNGVEVVKLDVELSTEIDQWQLNFEWNSLNNPDFDWEAFNKQGGKLFKKLKQQVGHLFNGGMVYDVPYEYYVYLENGVATL